ncbi:unnamed protein product [Oikopleura dioica]|uniref:Uncharacterized protein n=1 Tax=Oikopleura dioica TaxID=34765 RepID=E4X179_OIKDI|nr:unnamed protein product [Oikopleura dioica]
MDMVVESLDRYLVMELDSKKWILINELMGSMGSWDGIKAHYEVVPSAIIKILDPSNPILRDSTTEDLCRAIPKIFEAGEWTKYCATKLSHLNLNGPEDWLLQRREVGQGNTVGWILEHCKAASMTKLERSALWAKWSMTMSICLDEDSVLIPTLKAGKTENICFGNLNIQQREDLKNAIALAEGSTTYFERNAWGKRGRLPNIPLLHNFLGVLSKPLELFEPSEEISRDEPDLCKLVRKRNNLFVNARSPHCHDLVINWRILEPLIRNGLFSTAHSLINEYLHPLPIAASPFLLDETLAISSMLAEKN